MAERLNYMSVRLIDEAKPICDWLSRLLEDPEGGPARLLIASDVLLFPMDQHALHDGSAAALSRLATLSAPPHIESWDLLPGCYCMSRPN